MTYAGNKKKEDVYHSLWIYFWHHLIIYSNCKHIDILVLIPEVVNVFSFLILEESHNVKIKFYLKTPYLSMLMIENVQLNVCQYKSALIQKRQACIMFCLQSKTLVNG